MSTRVSAAVLTLSLSCITQGAFGPSHPKPLLPGLQPHPGNNNNRYNQIRPNRNHHPLSSSSSGYHGNRDNRREFRSRQPGQGEGRQNHRDRHDSSGSRDSAGGGRRGEDLQSLATPGTVGYACFYDYRPFPEQPTGFHRYLFSNLVLVSIVTTVSLVTVSK